MPTRRHRNWLRLPTQPERPTPFDDFFRDHGTSPWWRDSTGIPELHVDVTEDDAAFCIRAEMPGVDQEDIDVLVRDNHVVISAEVKHDVQRADEKVLVAERSWGKAYRAFILPSDVNGDDTGTHYARGVLTLTLPKKVGIGAQAKAPG